MKKIIYFLTLAFLFTISTKTTIAATICPSDASGFGSLCEIDLGGNLISGAITLLFIIAVIVAIFYIIWGGIKWIMSSGDKANLQQAREHVIAAIIGLVIVFLVYFIVSFVLTIFGLKGFSWNIPTLIG